MVPKVSIMIPTFNRAKLLSRAIRSCQRQTHKNVEVVVYDDGSTDNTESVVRGIAAKDSRVVYHKGGRNLGEIASRTRLMGLATGVYGCWLDSDDLCNRWRVAYQLRVLTTKTNPIPSFVRTAVSTMNSKNENAWKEPPLPVWKYDRMAASALFRMDIVRRTPYDASIPNGADVVHELEMMRDSGAGVVLPFECYHQDKRPRDRMSRKWHPNVSEKAKKAKNRLLDRIADLRRHLNVIGLDELPPVVPNAMAREFLHGYA